MTAQARPTSSASVLVLSDGKPGHRNQALALAALLDLPAAEARVAFRGRAAKALSYVLDRLGMYHPGLYRFDAAGGAWSAIIAAGSEAYYPAKTLARRLGVPVAAVMLPRGYRLDFDLIVAPAHDRPPRRANLREVPVNLCRVVATGLWHPEANSRYVSLMIGGGNQVYSLPVEHLRGAIDKIRQLFPEHRLLAATSRRTPPEVEAMLRDYPFERLFLYSENPANPLGDFLAASDYVFLTADSTSMISEAVTFGSASIEVIPLPARRAPGKFARLIDSLAARGCLHVFDGNLGDCGRKIDLRAELVGVRLCA